MSLTAAFSELVNPKRGHHGVVVEPDGHAHCSCATFRLRAQVWSAALAKRLAWAHLARPDATTEELLKFVCGGTGNAATGEPSRGPEVPTETAGAPASVSSRGVVDYFHEGDVAR